MEDRNVGALVRKIERPRRDAALREKCRRPQLADAILVAHADGNLALHDDPRYSLADEAGCVRGLGMDYVHIPVQFSAPTEENLRAFVAAMDAHRGKTILVHCAANYRVTAFAGLYRVLREGWTMEKAFEPMRTVWEPDPVWTQFIANMLQRTPG